MNMCLKVITRAEVSQCGRSMNLRAENLVWQVNRQSFPQEKEILLPHHFLQEKLCVFKQRSAMTTEFILSTLAQQQLLLRTSHHFRLP